MRRVAAGVILVPVLLAGCQDSGVPTAGPDDSRVSASSLPDHTDVEARINNRINALFPQPEKADAHREFDRIKDAVEDADLRRARSLMSGLLHLAETTELKDPDGSTTEEALDELVNLLFEFVGLEPPVDDDDGTVQVAEDGQDNTITTESEFAGTFIPDDAISEDVVIVIERLTEDEQTDLPGGDCLPIDLEQREGCYRFDRIPEGSFDAEVEVGVCAPETIPEEFQLHKFEPEEAAEGVVALDNIALSFELDCDDPSFTRSSRSPLPWRFAKAAWDATGGRLLGWLGPRPLRAINVGFGGATTNFSRIGWAKAMDVDVVAGDDQFAPPGSRVATEPQVVVTHLPEARDGHPIQGAEVTFTVLEGGGTLNVGPNASITDTTDSEGLASVAWTLGDPGLNTLRAVVPRDTVIFTANAGDSIFVADFNDEPVGAAPRDPLIGEWSSVLGDVKIRAARGLLDDQPVVLEDTAGIGGGFSILNGKTSVIATSGVYQVAWQMAVDSLSTGGRASFSVSDPAGPVIGKVAMQDDGDIVAGTQDTGLSDTGVDWEDGVPNSFLLTVDLDAGEVSLTIGDTEIFDGKPMQASATALQRIEMASSGTTPPVTAAFDNIVVVKH